MPSISEKSGVEGVFSYAQEKNVSERSILDKKFVISSAQGEGRFVGGVPAPIAPPKVCESAFMQVGWGRGEFPPSSAIEPGFLENPGFLLFSRWG